MTLHAAAIGPTLATHRPYLVRLARQRLRDAALAEDVVQDTLVAALRGAKGFEGRASARTWLTGILLRRLADTVRRESRRPRAWAAAAEVVDAADGDAAPAGDDDALGQAWIDWRDPQRTLELRQSLAAIESCLASLPDDGARIVRLREIEGLSNEETARELGLSPARVALALHRARARLRACAAA